MELKIRNGDYVLDGVGKAEQLSGSEELVQRVLYKLTARRGTFPFIPELGSQLHRVSSAAPRERSGAAEQAVREALSDEKDLEVTAVDLQSTADDLYALRVFLNYRGREIEVGLTVQ